MTGQAAFALRGHNPDVLTCIANLSNDEVFTPPEFANQMLDTLERAWAESNDGASIWADPNVTFLDPFTKSGVFLREITRRLTDGLASQMPDLEDRVDHILTKQVFGIGITRLTSLLARRSVYCSKDATGQHSIATSFDRDWGNIWFERTEHTWVGRKKERRAHPLTSDEQLIELAGTGRCEFCGASEAEYGRDPELESHAYALIHTYDIKARVAELFGADMQFDVIIGNPPYQMREDNSGEGNSASPIYQKFVLAGQSLDPAYLMMVTPTRWVAGGKGLDEYRAAMLSDRRIRSLVDYADPSEVFAGVTIRGGVSYFLWDRSYRGTCRVTTVKGGETVTADRTLDEFDVFVRDPRAAAILRRVLAVNAQSFSNLVSARNPFGLGTNFYQVKEIEGRGDLTLHYIRQRKRAVGFVDSTAPTKNRAALRSWKAFLPKAGTDGSATPDSVLTQPIIAGPSSVCTDSFLFVEAASEGAARSIASYYATRLFRFLVSLRKITQDASRETYRWVPVQVWDRIWTDEELYARYELTADEIAFIESQVRPMGVDIDRYTDD
ncbi:Eco57I restriction-modification methylase domain-containing protein [Microbacterium sp. 22303]|uniref:Eco57I restriction-modification methylase domain-containing protein n=1 Tax=Microbacterium sp. 22303 TaxID=3453905 RepID=UPI003F84BDBB